MIRRKVKYTILKVSFNLSTEKFKHSRSQISQIISSPFNKTYKLLSSSKTSGIRDSAVNLSTTSLLQSTIITELFAFLFALDLCQLKSVRSCIVINSQLYIFLPVPNGAQLFSAQCIPVTTVYIIRHIVFSFASWSRLLILLRSFNAKALPLLKCLLSFTVLL